MADMSFEVFAAAAAKTTAAQDGWLIGQGVDAAWLYGGAARYGVVRPAANDNDNEGWPPVVSGVKSLIVVPEMPLCDPWHLSCPVSFNRVVGDLIACDPRAPDRMFSSAGCSMINPDAIDYARHFEVDLRIFANPIAYLVGKQVGCVIVDWRDMTAFKLIGPRKIVCDTLEIAERVDALFVASRAPDIHIVNTESEAA
ncbi:hypothetical protein [Thalassospira xiamenensis]|uniref:hypothetical protein n=1 Tax=Thalassospira xiamenensis TaxID=220697 RepID=UPI000DEDF637|nr:hypothetical protein [Thalassospira xiamenensis]RCK40476.1 hypothetical protein TH24_11105 [Thalassospira xiamenensis]